MSNVVELPKADVKALVEAKNAVSNCIDLLDAVSDIPGVYEIDMKLRDLYIELCDKIEVAEKK